MLRVHRREHFSVAKQCDVSVVLTDHEGRPKVVGYIRRRLSGDVRVCVTNTKLSAGRGHDTIRSACNDEHDLWKRQPAPVLSSEDVCRYQNARKSLQRKVAVVVVPFDHAECVQPKALANAA
jgi:hypothetical protein